MFINVSEVNSNRDKSKCYGCMYEPYNQCSFVKLDGHCAMTGRQVSLDYTKKQISKEE